MILEACFAQEHILTEKGARWWLNSRSFLKHISYPERFLIDSSGNRCFMCPQDRTGKASNIVPAEAYRNHPPFHFHHYEALALSVQTAEEGDICRMNI